MQQAKVTPGNESGEDECQILLLDGEESDDAGAALVVPEKETDAAVLGTGNGGVALPNASNASLITAQANDPDCLRCATLVNKPRAQWSPHLAAAPLHFLYVAGVLCAR